MNLRFAALVVCVGLGLVPAAVAVAKTKASATPRPTPHPTPRATSRATAPAAPGKHARLTFPAADTPIAKGPEDASPNKPELASLLKEKSIKRVVEDFDVITNSDYLENDDFAFVNSALIRAPLRYTRPLIMDFKLYPKMSSALKKFEYDPKTQVIEIEGEASGLRMHSWVKVDQRFWDVIRYTIVAGDMRGFKIDAYLYEKEGKTVAVAKGLWPQGRKAFSSVVALLFKPVSEVVIGVATKNFRSYIEEEYLNHAKGR